MLNKCYKINKYEIYITVRAVWTSRRITDAASTYFDKHAGRITLKSSQRIHGNRHTSEHSAATDRLLTGSVTGNTKLETKTARNADHGMQIMLSHLF